MVKDGCIQYNTISVGLLEVNCYGVYNPENRNLYIIDPGSEPEKIIRNIMGFDYERVYILLTHAHVDHIGGIGGLISDLNVERIYLHKDDTGLYHSPDNHLMPFLPAAKDLPEPEHEFPSDDFEIMHTPGHSKGSVCFYFPLIPALFSGDTLFAGSIGRTDLPGGNMDVIIHSIREKIFCLPEGLQVYPGHGPMTTVGSEKMNNPYV